MIEDKIYNCLTEDEKMIRTKVFVEEQGFENEFDEIDNTAYHIVAYVDGKPAGCIRYFYDDDFGEYHIGRLAVLKEYRKHHLGIALVSSAEFEIKTLGGEVITLSAQVRVSGFYKKLGYNSEGEIYFDEYCEHIKMVKNLD